jgi:SMC interacting uncharacterized protein involved in chromosome segregation
MTQKRYNRKFLIHFSHCMIEELRNIADEQHMSISAFVRQSVSKNINLTKQLDRLSPKTQTLGF